MYNLIVRTQGWEGGQGTVDLGRTLEYTTEQVRAIYKPNDKPNLDALSKFPTIFASETSYKNDQDPARVGTITRAVVSGHSILVDYVLDPDIAPIPNAVLTKLAGELQIDMRSSIHEFSRNHWSTKDADLFRVLFKHSVGVRAKPKVFTLSDVPQDMSLVAAMMPFDAKFAPVLKALTKAATDAGMTLKRADDIWINDHIIQDVVTLLCQAKAVICDVTGRNANVFYEMGIAHMLPREVIMITQDSGDVPFDIAHIRHIKYLGNGEGLKKLTADVQSRLETLKALSRSD